ncbi:MAG TPA: GGDEF domain-containing protein, partial [Actinomycetota bacterium]|nr:GGDEF domain-containing protein [Actinomycetota bacterium]
MAAIMILERDVRAAGLRHPAAVNLDAVEHRRSQLWTISFVVMAVLAVGTTFLSESIPRLADDASVGTAPAVRLGLLALVAGLVLYVSEKERHLRRLTRLLIQGSASATVAVAPGRDALTGLLDRDAFLSQLSAAIDASREHGESLALLLVDVDRFREINARHGQRAGDLLLQELSRRIRSAAPTAAGARLRSDEFGLLTPGATSSEARDLARRLSQVLR